MNTKKRFDLAHLKLIISAVLLAVLLAGPLYANAGFLDKILSRSRVDFASKENQISFSFSLIQEDSILAVRPLVIPKTYKPKRVYTVKATAYSSTPEQTDDTPFITAAGTHVRDGVIAANFLPIGTIVKIPELFGDKVFIVEDRMHSRYWFNIDIWFSEKELAKEFGRKTVKIEIVS